MDEKEKTIALLIDCDNVSFKVIDYVLNDLKKYGNITIKRAYGNWEKNSIKKLVTKIK